MRNSCFISRLHRGSTPHQQMQDGLDSSQTDQVSVVQTEPLGYLVPATQGLRPPDRLTVVQ